MNPDAYVREYLAPITSASRAVTADPTQRVSEEALRAIVYPHDACGTLADISKNDLLLALRDVLGIGLDRQLRAESLRAVLAEPLHRAAALQQELDLACSELEQSRLQLERLQSSHRQELDLARSELEHSRHQLEHLQSSRSWRLTSPLRRLVALVGRFGRRGRGLT